MNEVAKSEAKTGFGCPIQLEPVGSEIFLSMHAGSCNRLRGNSSASPFMVRPLRRLEDLIAGRGRDNGIREIEPPCRLSFSAYRGLVNLLAI